MKDNYKATKDIVTYSKTANKLREFFLAKGFVEMHTQDRLSILAACEDPSTIATYQYAGEIWPLPQTGQMWLEYELLQNPDLKGIFCMSTSFRDEKEPIPGRHEIIFPMFEFEAKGNFNDLRKLEVELCEHMGLGEKSTFTFKSYTEMSKKYNTDELNSDHEKQMKEEYGNVFFLEKFPYHTSPFWNMKKEGELANKIDVIIDGKETIGSAEREVDPVEMRRQFYSISNGEYSHTLFSKFGRKRVEQELEDFLSFNFFPRFGGGIGMTRLISALTA